MPCRTVSYRTVPYRTVHTVPYRTVPYRTVPYSTVPYLTVPMCRTLYCIFSTVPYLAVPYRAVPCRTVPYRTVQLQRTVPCRIVPHPTDIRTEENANAQVGGVGVDVEVDEVCLRARWVMKDGVWHREWIRYLAAVERGSSKIVLRQLDTRLVAGAGQGGGGALSNEELLRVVLPPGGPPLFRPGTIVHTDSAKAYRWARFLGLCLRFPQGGAMLLPSTGGFTPLL